MTKTERGRITPKGTKNYPKARHAKEVRETSKRLAIHVRRPLGDMGTLAAAIQEAAATGVHG